ncbi:MAG: hypothetical protein N4A62_20070 [Marinisporobacter sp.]|jgi:hypothetical protein|nr:hypothetical protein [Marinisporobacter sp.]
MFNKQKILTLIIILLFILSTSYVFAHHENTNHSNTISSLSNEELAFWGIPIDVDQENYSTSIDTNEDACLFWGIPMNLR